MEIQNCRCIDVTGAYGAQQTELNISLTAIGLLWTTTDFIAKGHIPLSGEESGMWIFDLKYRTVVDNSALSFLNCHNMQSIYLSLISEKVDGEKREEETLNSNKPNNQASIFDVVERDKLLISIFSLLQTLGADERPEVLKLIIFLCHVLRSAGPLSYL